MTNNKKVIQAVMEAIDELNLQLPKEENIKKSSDTVLLGDGGNLDSLRLISLITTVEQKIEEFFGMTITLLDDASSLENDNPFRTVSNLADYVTSVLEKKAIE
jgi:acyl carrier protein